MATLNVDLPTITLTLRMPRLYGLRLRVVGWLIVAARWVAGSAMVIEIAEPGEPENEL